MKAHRTDLLSLVFGLLFVGLAVAWTARHETGVDLPSPGWLVAGALLVVGLLGLAGALRGTRNGRGAPPHPTDEEPGSRPARSTDAAAADVAGPDAAATDDTDEVRVPSVADAAAEAPGAATTTTGGDRDERAATPPQ